MLYAAYGSNLHPLRLRERIASAQPVTTGYLPDWSLHFHKRSKDGSAKCNIVPGEDGVHVAIFDISIIDKATLDKIEGVGLGYVPVDLHVPGVGVGATYVAAGTHVEDSLVPYDWYRELVLLGARAQGFPSHYQQMIEDIPASEDPDEDRRAANWRIVEAIESNGWPDAHR